MQNGWVGLYDSILVQILLNDRFINRQKNVSPFKLYFFIVCWFLSVIVGEKRTVNFLLLSYNFVNKPAVVPYYVEIF